MLHEVTVSEFLGDIKTNKQNPTHSETFVGLKYFWALCVQSKLNGNMLLEETNIRLLFPLNGQRIIFKFNILFLDNSVLYLLYPLYHGTISQN